MYVDAVTVEVLIGSPVQSERERPSMLMRTDPFRGLPTVDPGAIGLDVQRRCSTGEKPEQITT
jgi:hypothetical protein